MTRKISIVNQKGGVAKTTTAVNVAVRLAQLEHRVLLIDMDPQGNASQFLGLTDTLEAEGMYGSADFILGNGSFAPARDVQVKGLDLLPATDSLSYTEWELNKDVAGTGALAMQASLRKIQSEKYDFIIADCAPTLGTLAVSAIIGCPEVLIPVKLSAAAVKGAVRLRQTVLDRLRDRVNPEIRILGVLGTFFKASANTPKEVLTRLREAFGPLVFENYIHDAQAVDDASNYGKPVVLKDPSHRTAKEYAGVVDELLKR